jgi:hypothetical protein
VQYARQVVTGTLGYNTPTQRKTQRTLLFGRCGRILATFYAVQLEYNLLERLMQDGHQSKGAGLKTLAALKTQVPTFTHVVAGHGETSTL